MLERLKGLKKFKGLNYYLKLIKIQQINSINYDNDLAFLNLLKPLLPSARSPTSLNLSCHRQVHQPLVGKLNKTSTSSTSSTS
jgi:hypothetical protein